MRPARTGFISIWLAVILLLTAAFTKAAPLFALAMNEGRTYDQAHDTGFIDWSGSAQYVYITHRDGSSLPPQEGGASCSSSCTEWVTRLGNGGVASGSFDRDVSYFEAMVEFTRDSNVGSATLRACSAVSTWYLYNGSGGLPGFVSMILTVPSGCRSWSLSASGGYVDFRSVDVYYSGPPATPTSTSTPVPSATPTATRTPTLTPTSTHTPTLTFTPTFTPTSTLTFTPTNTSTPTFTPTSTPTNTPSPTPTPLPPVITGQVICDLWGDDGWCRGEETLELAASDPQGLDVTISGNLNGAPFTCGSSCNLPLPEGVGTANYSVTSTSGRTATGSSTWQRDDTPPILDIVLPTLDGRNGWYVSEVDVSVSASDAISGLYSFAGSLDEGASWISFPIHLTDGVYCIAARARDVAGNEALVTEVISVDTLPPFSQFSSHSNGELVRGEVILAGRLDDVMSGADEGELSLDGGTAWQAVSMGAGGAWSFVWHTNEVPNGQYILQMRGKDQAGNLGSAASLTLVVDNGPPAVSITERWWIWEVGELKVSPNHFPIASVKVTISDPQNRWPAVVLDLDPDRVPDSISWNRRFADGTLAPPGEYRVAAVSCDIHDLCGSDKGIIAIPFVATSTAALTPSPIATIPLTPHPTFAAAKMPAAPTFAFVVPPPEISPGPVQATRSFPFWQLLGLLGLFLAVASASVIDPRPAALDGLRESLGLISNKNVIDPSKNEE